MRGARGPRRRRGAERLVHGGNGRRRQDGLPDQRRGPNAVASAVQTCVNGSSTRAPDYFETLAPSAGDQPDRLHEPALCGTPGITVPTAAPWITTDCRKPAGANNATVFADPRFCINDPGTAPPYLKVACTTVQTMRADRGAAAGLPDRNHVRRHDRLHRHDLREARLLAADPGRGVHRRPIRPFRPYIVTTCGTRGTDTPVAFCNVGDPPFWDGSDWVTCVKPAGANNAGPTQVAT